MKNLPKMIVYQYILKAERTDDSLKWNHEKDVIDTLFFNFNWESIFEDYSKRTKFYYGFSISGHGSELFPVIDAKVELHKPSLTTPEFLIEVASMPSKLSSKHREALHQVLDNQNLIEQSNFKIWWEDDPRGPRKRKLKDKQKIIEQVKNINSYNQGDDLKMEDADVSIHEALAFFGFDKHASPKDVRPEFKKTYRQLQIKHHPDSETGSDETFLFLQKCYNILKKWIR